VSGSGDSIDNSNHEPVPSQIDLYRPCRDYKDVIITVETETKTFEY